jgi:predicted Zn-dependent protease with MMP-like domain
MYTIDEVSEILDDIVDEIPEDFFKDLNGGIILLEECKPHPENIGSMYILGEYHHSRAMGRYICIYYGSFMRLFSYYTKDKLRERLRETIIHEFTHHLESLAGEKGLEIQDAINLEKYRRLHKKS